MSNSVLTAVFEGSRSKGAARLVLLAIADRANNEGRAWCGTADIAKRAGILRNHVVRHTRLLSELGELEIGYREGKRSTNCYIVKACTMVVLSQGGAVPLQSVACTKEVQNMSHGGTRTQRTHKNPIVAFAPVFDSDDFKALWTKFLRHRQEKRNPVKPTSYGELATKLREMGEADATVSIRTSIENGWTSIWPAKRQQHEKPKYDAGLRL